MTAYESTELMDVMAFAGLRGLNDRTIREWLRNGELPAAQKDERGKWWIPANAARVQPQTTAMVAAPSPGPATMAVPPRAFFTVEEAAQLLGITAYRITQERVAFGVVPWGTNGALLVPAPIVRHYLGI